MKENFSQEAPHSAEDLSAPELSQHQRPDQINFPSATPAYSSRRERIKWPKSSDTTAWLQFDDDLDSILEATLAGPVHKKIDSLTTLTYNLTKERFGHL